MGAAQWPLWRYCICFQQYKKFLLSWIDDLTVFAIVNNINDRIKLQNELNNLLEWSKKWQLNINFDKCHVIHIGKKNLHFDYCFNNIAIHVSMCEKFLVFYLTLIYLSEKIYLNVWVKPVECAI